MLILIRNYPDDRLRDIIASIAKDSPETTLVYLDRSPASGSAPSLPILADRTYSLQFPVLPGITPIDGQTLLRLIHDHDRVLVLP
ncbi:MAG: hypothetical protein D084_Lepto4C00369G0003 [Leptospirillum sp. Group IV 'UBA BS']|nr:MAG: hypothetical protein D084_Lepto4C00369G0003 [Leptospirillum sp. Group IV 'UBA BS']